MKRNNWQTICSVLFIATAVVLSLCAQAEQPAQTETSATLTKIRAIQRACFNLYRTSRGLRGRAPRKGEAFAGDCFKDASNPLNHYNQLVEKTKETCRPFLDAQASKKLKSESCSTVFADPKKYESSGDKNKVLYDMAVAYRAEENTKCNSKLLGEGFASAEGTNSQKAIYHNQRNALHTTKEMLQNRAQPATEAVKSRLAEIQAEFAEIEKVVNDPKLGKCFRKNSGRYNYSNSLKKAAASLTDLQEHYENKNHDDLIAELDRQDARLDKALQSIGNADSEASISSPNGNTPPARAQTVQTDEAGKAAAADADATFDRKSIAEEINAKASAVPPGEEDLTNEVESSDSLVAAAPKEEKPNLFAGREAPKNPIMPTNFIHARIDAMSSDSLCGQGYPQCNKSLKRIRSDINEYEKITAELPLKEGHAVGVNVTEAEIQAIPVKLDKLKGKDGILAKRYKKIDSAYQEANSAYKEYQKHSNTEHGYARVTNAFDDLRKELYYEREAVAHLQKAAEKGDDAILDQSVRRQALYMANRNESPDLSEANKAMVQRESNFMKKFQKHMEESFAYKEPVSAFSFSAPKDHQLSVSSEAAGWGQAKKGLQLGKNVLDDFKDFNHHLHETAQTLYQPSVDELSILEAQTINKNYTNTYSLLDQCSHKSTAGSKISCLQLSKGKISNAFAAQKNQFVWSRSAMFNGLSINIPRPKFHHQ